MNAFPLWHAVAQMLDDSTRLAARARAFEVDVILDVILDVTANVPHVFQGYTGVLEEADQALDRRGFSGAARPAKPVRARRGFPRAHRRVAARQRVSPAERTRVGCSTSLAIGSAPQGGRAPEPPDGEVEGAP